MTGSSVKLTRNGRTTIPPTSASATNSGSTPFHPPATAEIPLHHRLHRLNENNIVLFTIRNKL